jgi:hypothetical protein
MPSPEETNVISLPFKNARRETFTFACGGTVTIEVPADGPPLTVAMAIYFLSNAQHQIHRMMEP